VTSRLTRGERGKIVWTRYCCEIKQTVENRMCWEREILVLKENCGEEFELSQFK
jgi:hypothetical protein